MIYKVRIRGERTIGDNILQSPEIYTGVFDCFAGAARWAYETLHLISNELGGINRNVSVEINISEGLASWRTLEEEDK